MRVPPGRGVLQVQQSWAHARTSSTAFPPRTGAAAAGGRRAGLPRPGPPLPALLLLLAVLPAAQERGAPGRRLLLHSLVRDHRHPGVQVSVGRGGPGRGVLMGAGPGGAGPGWGGQAGSPPPPPQGSQPAGEGPAAPSCTPCPVPAPASPWGSMATGRPVTASIGPPTRSATPTAQWQGSRTA